ncbi:MAG: thioredoxin-dependent thiol peroxidase [Verrucomicrobiales bacterium]|nr:thioredoxin-dependent thiol peroxidase [Verrucomicrobiales bacterium]
MTEQVKVGDEAPEFEAPVVGGEYEDGVQVSLKALRGRKVVLYFYPKDDTPGCTKQACALRDSWGKIGALAQVFGVSIDPVKRHRKFIDKYELPFPLISDESKEIVEAYGVWVQKKLYGREYMGTERTTFVIDEKGKVMEVFRKVKPLEHLDQLLAVLS